jgi:hypothetical protein
MVQHLLAKRRHWYSCAPPNPKMQLAYTAKVDNQTCPRLKVAGYHKFFHLKASAVLED